MWLNSSSLAFSFGIIDEFFFPNMFRVLNRRTFQKICSIFSLLLFRFSSLGLSGALNFFSLSSYKIQPVRYASWIFLSGQELEAYEYSCHVEMGMAECAGRLFNSELVRQEKILRRENDTRAMCATHTYSA